MRKRQRQLAERRVLKGGFDGDYVAVGDAAYGLLRSVDPAEQHPLRRRV